MRSHQGGETRNGILLNTIVTMDAENFRRKRRGIHWLRSDFSERALVILEGDFPGVGDGEAQMQ